MSRYNENLDYLIKDLDISKEELQEIIVEADKIISDTNIEKDKLIEAYLKKVQCLQKLSKYNESKEFVDILLELNPNMPEALLRLGNIYERNKEYNRAIVEYNKAIDFNPEYAAAYNNHGITKLDLKNYHGAITNFDKAIEINPNYANAYCGRGNAKYYLKDYDGAIEDYDKAIEINPNVANAHNNRGLALEKINATLKDKADSFIKAGADILDVLSKKNRIEIVKIMLDKNDFFQETIENDKTKIEKYKDIYIQSLEIILELHVKEETELFASHYTRKNVAEILLFDNYIKDKDDKCNRCFRLNSLNTSNDPEEGKTLFHYLFPQEEMSSQVEEFGAFAGCFILNNDSLNQFRLYGKTENNEEGTGVSIAINKNFFNEKIIMSVENTSESKDSKLLPLFRCIYIDPKSKPNPMAISLGQKEEYVFYREKKTEEEYKKYKEEIDKLQISIKNKLEKLQGDIEKHKLNSDIVYKLLLNLRYLVKHAAFKEEQECRIIKIKKLSDKEVNPNENNCFYIDYLEMSKENVSEICFAPKAKDIDKFKQHLARNNYNIKCYKSNAPLA